MYIVFQHENCLKDQYLQVLQRGGLLIKQKHIMLLECIGEGILFLTYSCHFLDDSPNPLQVNLELCTKQE